MKCIKIWSKIPDSPLLNLLHRGINNVLTLSCTVLFSTNIFYSIFTLKLIIVWLFIVEWRADVSEIKDLRIAKCTPVVVQAPCIWPEASHSEEVNLGSENPQSTVT